jgi:1-acyl-sn-glycerol-3-phosphate acyltransferase
MKNAMLCLKSGKKLGIFPEGTRSSEDGEVAPKVGAVRLAERNNAPLVPVYIPRNKKRFHRTTVVIGEPIYIEKIKGRRTKEQYDELADELMTKITQLGQQPSKATGA